MTINLNDCESMGINTRYSAEGIDEEYAYIGKKHCPFGTAFKLVRQHTSIYIYARIWRCPKRVQCIHD